MNLKERFLTLSQAQRDAQLLPVKDAAYLLRKHRTAVRRLIAQKKLSAVQVGGTYYVDRQSLEEFVKEYPSASDKESPGKKL